MSDGEILDEAEIQRLTAPCTQGAAQARHLERMLGCKIQRRPDGLPVVTRAMLERLDSRKAEPADAGINWTK